MLKTKKHLMLLALLFIPVLGFSQESKNKPEESKEIPSMIAIRDEGYTLPEGPSLFWNARDFFDDVSKAAITGAVGGGILGGPSGAISGGTAGAIGGAAGYIWDEVRGNNKERDAKREEEKRKEEERKREEKIKPVSDFYNVY